MCKKDVFDNVFSQVKEVEKDVAYKERQYDLFGSAVDRAIFSLARAWLQYILLCKENIYIFFCISNLVFIWFERRMLILVFSMRWFGRNASCFTKWLFRVDF